MQEFYSLTHSIVSYDKNKKAVHPFDLHATNQDG